MSLNAGSVTIASDGTASGDGLTFALYTTLMSGFAAAMAPYASQPYYKTIVLSTENGLSTFANQLATAFVDYLVSNAEVSVSVSAGGLQRLPSTLAAGQPTDAPSAPVTLTGTLA